MFWDIRIPFCVHHQQYKLTLSFPWVEDERMHDLSQGVASLWRLYIDLGFLQNSPFACSLHVTVHSKQFQKGHMLFESWISRWQQCIYNNLSNRLKMFIIWKFQCIHPPWNNKYLYWYQKMELKGTHHNTWSVGSTFSSCSSGSKINFTLPWS